MYVRAMYVRESPNMCLSEWRQNVRARVSVMYVSVMFVRESPNMCVSRNYDCQAAFVLASYLTY